MKRRSINLHYTANHGIKADRRGTFSHSKDEFQKAVEALAAVAEKRKELRPGTRSSKPKGSK